MAIHKGNDGTVRVGSNVIAHITSYTLDEAADTVEKTALGDSSKSFMVTLTSFSGSVDVFFDDDDTAQNALTIGAEVTLDFLPEGTGSGEARFTGTAIVTGLSLNTDPNSLVQQSITFQGSGGLTKTTV
mgnify:FL=1|jgi:hypothetical protein|tara:strand:+ start:127 stop:513 length:387 start_codon:yes stop_codon:yes gene_type:complete